jgi:competence protein ComEA
MALNARETRVLATLGVILVAGGIVRFVSHHRPEWTPGVTRSREPDPAARDSAGPNRGLDGATRDSAATPAAPNRPLADRASDPAPGRPAGRGRGPAAPPRPVRPGPARYGTAADLDSLFVDGRLDLNAAGEAHLVLLPRVGPALAARVVEYRRSHGPFRRVEDLMEVRGIGPKTLEMLRAHVCVRP